MALFISLCYLVFLLESVVASMKVTLHNVSPAVRGANVTFTATVSGYDGSDQLEFKFWDDAQPQHSESFFLASNESKWTVKYDRDLYESGDYTIKVELRKSFLGMYYYVSSDSTELKLTDSLNGNLVLVQNNTERPNTFVAVNKTVNHIVKLPENEIDFLNKNTSSVVTYWFVDCQYFDQTLDFSFNYTYGDAMSSHYVDAIVVANHEPLPPLPTTTTTTTTTTTLKPTTLTPNATQPASSILPTVTENSSTIIPAKPKTDQPEHQIAKRAVKPKTKKPVLLPKNFICKNSIVPIGESYTYGHYQSTIEVREPIVTVNITGLNWLQHGDLMNLQVKYSGSPPFDYCAEYIYGKYNITGNETCQVKTRTVSNVFPLVHYFSDSDQHTVVVIIENDIGKVVTRATINIYKATVQAQLSVIVIPVVFCLLAVILVVFGIAYYQHRSRYTVEVAEFDFGQQANFDYKTFTERLRDSFKDTFNFRQEEDTSSLIR